MAVHHILVVVVDHQGPAVPYTSLVDRMVGIVVRPAVDGSLLEAFPLVVVDRKLAIVALLLVGVLAFPALDAVDDDASAAVAAAVSAVGDVQLAEEAEELPVSVRLLLIVVIVTDLPMWQGERGSYEVVCDVLKPRLLDPDSDTR